jgi:hypothetical protein
MSQRNITTPDTQVSAVQITLHLVASLQICGLEWAKFYVVLHTYVSCLSVNTAFKVDVGTRLGSVKSKTNMYKYLWDLRALKLAVIWFRLLVWLSILTLWLSWLFELRDSDDGFYFILYEVLKCWQCYKFCDIGILSLYIMANILFSTT